MARLTWARVAATAGAVTALSLVIGVVLDSVGVTPQQVPWTVPPILLTAGAAALWFGWQVRQYRAGKRPSLDPLQAARTAMFAQAAAYGGAALAGAYGGYGLSQLPNIGHDPRRDVVISAAVAVAASALLAAAGWFAERWCGVDEDGDDTGRTPGATA